jgi:hypothetical protein
MSFDRIPDEWPYGGALPMIGSTRFTNLVIM